ncbi:MAG: hypothetical protein K5986_02630, partial [Clostridium sp.]|nr:hypothetical protein [Clostridium sp.]
AVISINTKSTSLDNSIYISNKVDSEIKSNHNEDKEYKQPTSHEETVQNYEDTTDEYNLETIEVYNF